MIKTYKLFSFLMFLGLVFSSCKDEVKTLKSSQFLTDSIYSNALSEYRKHDIYLPSNFSKEKSYPIVYATDGNSNITSKKELLDSLISNKIIKPLIFVASHSNGKVADSTSAKRGDGSPLLLAYRYFEYTNQYNEKDSIYLHLKHRFANHMTYFSEEFIPQFEKKYNQQASPSSRYFYGVSNGAGFGMSLLNTHPELISNYLCFSIFGGDIQTNDWNTTTSYPDLYVRYGSKEPFFLKDDAEYLKQAYQKSNSLIEVKVFDGGHSDKFWQIEFTNIISRVLSAK